MAPAGSLIGIVTMRMVSRMSQSQVPGWPNWVAHGQSLVLINQPVREGVSTKGQGWKSPLWIGCL